MSFQNLRVLGFRDKIDIEFEHWPNFTVKLREVNTVPSVPTLAKSCSLFGPNAENDGLLSYCKRKRNLATLFLNDINSQLEYGLKGIIDKFLQFTVCNVCKRSQPRNYCDNFIRKTSKFEWMLDVIKIGKIILAPI